MKKDNVGISPLKENGEGEAVHDSRKKADLLLEDFYRLTMPTFLNCILAPFELLSC